MDTWSISQTFGPENLELGPYESNQARNSLKGLEWHILPCKGGGGGSTEESDQWREWSRFAEKAAELRRENTRRRERETEPAAASASVVDFSSLKLHWLEICELSCTFPANLPLLIKPGGLGFYYLQLTKPGLKQMRAYFQIIGPKRLEASTQLTYLWKMQRNLHVHSQKDGLFSHEG